MGFHQNKTYTNKKTKLISKIELFIILMFGFMKVLAIDNKFFSSYYFYRSIYIVLCR